MSPSNDDGFAEWRCSAPAKSERTHVTDYRSGTCPLERLDASDRATVKTYDLLA